MSAALKSPAPLVADLKKHLAHLDHVLQPLLGRSIPSLCAELETQTLSGAGESSKQAVQSDGRVLTGKLQSAQLQASLAYVLLDLVWILLKVEGKDVQRHPVVADLKRVQGYLEKVQKVAKGQATDEKDAAPAIDKGKARRFIQGALGKRTIFAEDGTVERIVDASKEDKDDEASSVSDEESGDDNDEKGAKKSATRPTEDKGSPQSSAPAAGVQQDKNVESDSGEEVWEKPVSKKERREAQKLKAAKRKASELVRNSKDAVAAGKSTEKQVAAAQQRQDQKAKTKKKGKR